MREFEDVPAGGFLTANEKVYRALRRDIARGKLPPGMRLVHRQIAREMGTSTIPVIDALRRLEGEGLLVTKPGVGTQVRQWQPHELEEIYLLRAANEGIACRLFAQRATLADLALLEAYCNEYDRAAGEGEADACREIDGRLHTHIARAARSAELLRLFENFGLICRTLDATLLPQPLVAQWVPTPGVHTPLLRALQARDAELAEQEGRAHVLRSGRQALALLGRQAAA
jgi:DNA-binding GntR family transcriptional regulator